LHSAELEEYSSLLYFSVHFDRIRSTVGSV
jgi:hypothetical protein